MSFKKLFVGFLTIAACDNKTEYVNNEINVLLTEPDSSPETQKSTKNFEAIAEQACKMAGGECLSGSDLMPDNVLVAGINCRPLQPGMFCIRKDGVCKGHVENRCCEKDELTGKFVRHGRVGCDRGYPVCLNPGDWLASSSATCTIPLPSSVPEDAPNLWQNAIDVQSVSRWACNEAGGRHIERDEYIEAVERNEYGSLCSDGYTFNFSDFAVCCISKAACPENKNVECCKSDGTLDIKYCIDGKAICNPTFVDLGMVREVKIKTCKPF